VNPQKKNPVDHVNPVRRGFGQDQHDLQDIADLTGGVIGGAFIRPRNSTIEIFAISEGNA
jgi:hypothetical protein